MSNPFNEKKLLIFTIILFVIIFLLITIGNYFLIHWLLNSHIVFEIIFTLIISLTEISLFLKHRNRNV